jgi:hypothetical protein
MIAPRAANKRSHQPPGAGAEQTIVRLAYDWHVVGMWLACGRVSVDREAKQPGESYRLARLAPRPSLARLERELFLGDLGKFNVLTAICD